MKKLLPFVLIAVSLAACNPDNSQKETPEVPVVTELPEKTEKPTAEIIRQFDLKPGHAGQIRIGMPIDSLKKMLPADNLKKIELEMEGEKYPAWEIRNAKAGYQRLLVAEEKCEQKVCNIFRLRILSPKFSTRENIRVGSTFGDVQKAYPVSFVGLGEADFVAVSEKQRMTFTLDISGFPPKSLDKIKVEDIPGNTPVTSILMY